MVCMYVKFYTNKNSYIIVQFYKCMYPNLKNAATQRLLLEIRQLFLLLSEQSDYIE